MSNNRFNITSEKNQTFNRLFTNAIDDLIYVNAQYDELSECYVLTFDQLNDFDQKRLAGLIMAYDDMYASEATGPDNPKYENVMLPALIATLKDPLHVDLRSDFVECWQEHVTNYFQNFISQKLADRLDLYNQEKLEVACR